MSEITPAQKTALLKLEGFKAIRDQYAKEQKMTGAGKKRRMKGNGGFWSDIYNWFVDAGTTVNDFLKRTKLISNIAGAVLPILAPIGTALLTANPLAAAASVGAAKATAEGIKSLGYGSKSMHRMPDGSMMKGKVHGGMMMRGMGNQPLAINPPDQRLRGVAPKSTMRGKGIYDTLSIFAPMAGVALSNLDSAQKKLMGKGEYTTADIDGVPTLSMLQNRKMRSLDTMMGKGYGTNFNTMGVNGIPQVSVAPANPGMIHNIGGKGMMKPRRRTKGMGGTEYGSVSSQFGNVKF
tara:strand:+ start:263 stop:1141 length:879 start_codon:yes stop_codon:yes gene_type:complete